MSEEVADKIIYLREDMAEPTTARTKKKVEMNSARYARRALVVMASPKRAAKAEGAIAEVEGEEDSKMSVSVREETNHRSSRSAVPRCILNYR